MITCPKCGTANLDANQTCSQCGTALPAPQAKRCPMCGTMNPSGNVTCSSCGARLVPLSASARPETPPEESEVPAWLAEVVPTLAKPSDRRPVEPVPAAESSEPDDWMSRLRGALEQPAENALTEQATPAEEVPDWLRDVAAPPAGEPEFDLAARLRGAAESPPATPPATLPPDETLVPDWLAQLAPTPPAAPLPPQTEAPEWLAPKPVQAPESPVSASPAPAEAEIPEWLRQLAPTPAQEPEVVSPAEPSPTEVPDWLAQLTPTQAKESEIPEVAPPSPPAEAQAPEWLAQLAPTTPTAAESEMPDWLKGLGVEPSAPTAPTPFVGEEAPEDIPAWLKDFSGPQAAPETPAETPEQIEAPEPPTPTLGEAVAPSVAPLPPTPTPPPGEGGLEAAQIPAWLEALKPQEPQAAAAPEEEPAETEGIMAGLRGILPAAAVAWQPLGAGISTRPEITPDDLARAGALQDLIARGVTSPVLPKGKSKAQRLWSDVQRLFVFLVLAVAVVIPLWPGMNLGLVSAPKLEGAPNAMFESIDKLPPDAAVLVAFDYDATQSPEMDAQARAVMQHLFARRAQVYVTSLYPAGPAAAQAVIIETRQLVSDTAPAKIVNLGYVPGQATAVAFINTTPYSTVIELAASPDTLRWWVEQLAARPGAPPLLSGVSAAAEPMSQPYLQSGHVKGMLVGIRDAVAYEMKLESPKTAQDLQRLAPLESIVTANVALIALIVLGGLVQLASGGESSLESRRGRT